MQSYQGYTLPNYGTDQTSADLHRCIIDNLGQSDSGLDSLDSIESTNSSQLYLAVAELWRLNPLSVELKSLHKKYITRIDRLSDQDLILFLAISQRV